MPQHPRHPAPSRRPRARPGFTLLELTLASIVAAMMLAAALGLFAALDRFAARYQQRADEIFQLERAQAVLRKAFASMVMSSADKPREGDPPLPDRPRLILEQSTILTDLPSFEPPRARFEDRLTEGRPGPQRLELSLAAQPWLATSLITPDIDDQRPTSDRPRVRLAASDSAQDEDLGVDEIRSRIGGTRPMTSDVGEAVAVRGVFDLVLNPPKRRAQPDAAPTYTLYYRPIAIHRPPPEESEPIVPGGGGGGDASQAPGPTQPPAQPPAEYQPLPLEHSVPLIKDLTYLRFVAFEDRVLRTTYETSVVIDLPAYVEVELATTSGLSARWLFEVMWQVGPELGEPSRLKEPEPPVETSERTEFTPTPAGRLPQSPTPLSPRGAPLPSAPRSSTPAPPIRRNVRPARDGGGDAGAR